LANAKFAVDATANPVEFEPEMVNLPVEDHQSVYLPVKSFDGERLLYTIRDKGREYLVSSTKTTEGWSLPQGLPFLEAYPQTAAPSLSPDGNLMLLTICNHRDNIGGCDLYLASRNSTTGEWRGPFNLGEQVNSRGWDSQPVFGPDGRTFYFSSDRSGGYGGRDIWYSRLMSGGNFAEPVNAGPKINSPGNEASPFLHQDGRTLFFKSNGHPGMGDYDIFISRKDEKGEWESPVNLGYPINTMAHDGAIFVDSDGVTAYMASDRFQPVDKRGIYRIYRFKLPDHAKAASVTYIEARVTDASTDLPLKANARIVNLSEDETVYNHILGDAGTMFAVLRSDASYSLNVDKKGYEFVSRRIIVKGEATAEDPFVINIALQPLPETGDTASPAIVLENVLFEFGSHLLDTSSHSELDRLVEYLNRQGEVVVEIHGHTDSIGNPEDNLMLSENRAQSVVDYLVANGVPKKRISAKGFGETKPIADNETEEGRALNRRTELVIVRNGAE
jgi:outer membrane protein OmpA-like peptidoglycan-associated protein